MGKTNRYARKKKHKKKLEKQYATKYGEYNTKTLRDRLQREAEEDTDSLWSRKHPPRNGGWEYWKIWYISGRRGFAKKYSDRKIRQKYRKMISKYDPDDIPVYKGADHEKEYNYNWTIW